MMIVGSLIPVWLKSVAIGAAIGLVLILGWVFWPSPGPSPAEEELRRQNELLVKANEQLAKDAEARTLEAQTAREEADAKLNEIGPLRTQRRVARRDGAARRDAIAATPDERIADSVRVQLERTRKAIRAVRPASESTEGGVTEPDHR